MTFGMHLCSACNRCTTNAMDADDECGCDAEQYHTLT